MHAGLADEVVHEGHVIGTGTEGRDGIAQHAAALAVGLEVPHGLFPGAEAVLKGLDLLAEVGVFAVVFDQRRLVVKEVDVAGSAAHEELHHAFRLGHHDLGTVRGLGAGERMKRKRAEALTGGLQELTTGEHDRTIGVHTLLASGPLSRIRAS